MTVDVDLIVEELLSGTRQLATRGSFVLVAVGPEGRPMNIPPLPVVNSPP